MSVGMKAELSKDDYLNLMLKSIREGKKMGVLDNSVKSGGGNKTGFLGEFAFLEAFGGERDHTYEYDIMYDDMKVEVKTKKRTVDPQPHYQADIFDLNTEQDCDIYYFVSINSEEERVWMCGYLTPDEFYDRASFKKKGQMNHENGHVYQEDCWVLPYTELKRLQ